MANQLLAARDGGKVGVRWAHNLVTRIPELKTRRTRQQARQRALCNDPEVIRPWFDLVQNTKAKYDILDDDIYNFDETGFAIGQAGSVVVVTASERRHRPLGLQPGDREWISVILGINAMGWAIPPFFIFKAKHHDQSWYEDVPGDWRIGVSENGWTSNDLGVEWLQHFIAHTKDRTVGSYRLLILDGHESHNSLAFQDLCRKHKIITLCMPPHSSHLLQPLDVACFAPLKQAYSKEIRALATSHISHIEKKAFLEVFKPAFKDAVVEKNICASFRAAGIAPHDPEAVLSKLQVKLRTPTPPTPEATKWTPKTPSTLQEIEAQSSLIRDRIRRHKSSSPASIIEALDQLEKGAEMMAHSAALLKGRVKEVEEANKAASQRKSRKRKRIQEGGTLSKTEVDEIVTQNDANKQLEEETGEGKARSEKGQRTKARCSRCGKTGHNLRTCVEDQVTPAR